MISLTNRLHVNTGEVDGSTSPKRTSAQPRGYAMPSSFLAPDVLKHLCRELDRDKVEAEFSTKVNEAELNSTDNFLYKSFVAVLETDRFGGSVTGERRYIFDSARISSNRCQRTGGKYSPDILPSSGAIRTARQSKPSWYYYIRTI